MADYTESEFNQSDNWKVYSAIIDSAGSGGDASAANQLVEIDNLEQIVTLLSPTDGLAVNDWLSSLFSLMVSDADGSSLFVGIYNRLQYQSNIDSTLTDLRKGNRLTAVSNLKTVVSGIKNNEQDAYDDAAEKWADVMVDNAGKFYTNFQINYILKPNVTTPTITEIICRMTALFNDE